MWLKMLIIVLIHRQSDSVIINLLIIFYVLSSKLKLMSSYHYHQIGTCARDLCVKHLVKTEPVLCRSCDTVVCFILIRVWSDPTSSGASLLCPECFLICPPTPNVWSWEGWISFYFVYTMQSYSMWMNL